MSETTPTKPEWTEGPWTLHHQPVDCRSGSGIDWSLFQGDDCIALLAPGPGLSEDVLRFIAASPDADQGPGEEG